MVYQRGNQREGSPHYILLYSDEENSEDEENIPLQPRVRSTSSPRKIEVINVQIKPDDTLQALAVRYRCTISELKRINKIHKENEIFAKRLIKVPVQPFSILTESLNQSENFGQDGYCTARSEEVPNIRTEQLIDLNTTPAGVESTKAEINTIILNSICEPLSLYNNNNSFEIADTEHDQLLSATESNTVDVHMTDTFKCSGDDCGLSWAHLLGFSLLLGFAGPIIYILYLTEFTAKSHSNANH